MNVTPQLIEQIDFSEKFRGYDPDQVDDFLEQVGATLAALHSKVESLSGRVEQAESEAATLRDQPAPAPAEVPPTALSDEEEAAQSTSTLMLAKRTADAAISEARQEATRLVADARTRAETQTTEATAEAERLIRDAQTQREDMLRRAREDADREKVAQRDALLEEIAGLDSRKNELVGDIDRLEGRIGEYRGALEQVHGSIRAVLDDPAALRTKPSLGIEANEAPTSSAFYYTGSNPVVSAAESIPLTGAEHIAPTQTAAGDVEADDRQPGPPVAPVPAARDAGTADPWAPGSWSEVSAAFEEPAEPVSTTLFEAPQSVAATSSASSSPFDTPADDVFEPAQPPTEAIARTPADSDRYLRDLDDAVNRTASGDRAMDAFFEGDEGGETRRFGRRR
jgi:cell division initiation protein